MKFLSALILMVFTISACSCRASIPNRVSYMENLANVQAMRDATAGLVDEDGLFCAGAFISQTEIVTAEHCTSRPGRMEIGSEDGHLVIHIIPPTHMTEMQVVTRDEFNQNQSHPVLNASVFRVVARDEVRDLALLRAVDADYDSVHAFFQRPTVETQGHIGIGTETYAIGHPAQIPWNVSHGFISADPILEDGREIIISSSQVFFGNSGGPLVDSHMNLIGISSGMPGAPGMGVGTHLAIFASPDDIVEFLSHVPPAE